MQVGIVDSGGANIASIQFALDRVGAPSFVSNEVNKLKKAQKLILPGVGAAQKAMHNLRDHGLIEFLQNGTQPLLGICLGMQLLFEFSEEGQVDCLGLLPGKVLSIPDKKGYSIPHMGWNQLQVLRSSSITQGIPDQSYVYFVHSFYVEVSPACIASTDYHLDMAAIVGQYGVWGCQFHPERSGSIGTQILENFCKTNERREQ
tara:strand:+ start:5166 stop:5774 length:609 start_codon:yes stop_codon:yes gene_type:complete